jgi:hypothetical protein
MGRSLAVAALALVGLLCAAGMGYAAYFVSRGSVAVPVTQLQKTPPANLTPSRVREHARPIEHAPPTVAPPPPPAPTTTVDDHGGRGRGGGGGGGHGSDD